MSSCQATRCIVGPVNRRLSFVGLLLCGTASVFFAATRPAVADDTTSFYNFTGGVSTDWMDPANWTSVVDGTTGTLPLAGSAADIAGGLTSVVGTAANPTPTINIESLYIGQDGDLHGPPDPANPNPTPPPPFLQYPAPGVGSGTLNQNAGTINVGVRRSRQHHLEQWLGQTRPRLPGPRAPTT